MVATDRTLDGPHGPLVVRVYTPSTPAGPGLVWLHGGGFAGGDLDMPEADWVSAQFAERGIVVVSVDYQRAPVPPEWAAASGIEPSSGVRYPVASEEAAFAFRWATESGLAEGPWALGGASAGGNLAAGAALRLARSGGPIPALAVLAYPTLHAVQAEPDAALRAALDADPAADTFGPDAVRGMYENYLGGSADTAEIFAVPGNATAGDLADFPPTIMINDEVDQLRVSGEAFAAALLAAGRDIDVSTEPGTRHGHLNDPENPAATASLTRFAARILALKGTPS
ncbi:alpha/beta hydrolase fold domain-containing protein [Microbacterium rhizomatis]|uniref:Alpha/beta hydrolase n=1 Tax=Microbacterium rhizomatis TaxID=1631477 RepID=A0A5J5J3S5_9MICO|nr:alpha/beta hydrolase fold domain-containing protein [Microbacterium rhizomatis]KAA9108544.1 alpha/beta hydrolase [Microbacterium rhizomatis]